MSILYKSLQKLRRQENETVHVPSFVSEYNSSFSRKKYFRIGLFSVVLLGIAMIPVFFVQSRLDVYQKSSSMPEHSPVIVSEHATSSVQNQEEIVEDPSQVEVENQYVQGKSPAPPAKPVILTQNQKFQEQTALQRQQLSDASERVRQQYPGAGSLYQSSHFVEEVADIDRADISQHLKGYSMLGLDEHLEEHFSRKADRNRRAMALNREMETAFAAGDREGVYGYLSLLRDVLPGTSPLVLKWEGTIAMQNADFEKARDKFSAVLNHSPRDHTAMANLALALVKLDQTEQARLIFRDLMVQSPDNPMIQSLSKALN
ncbi:MAG: tetratricopeptide repeat protein [Desulfonatronovibrio sp. MSAO_Bac4]|nr:MAG: tetratricopeptide repeat protein [Desulfonatronovibrio sp. MSAO_Bac4]